MGAILNNQKITKRQKSGFKPTYKSVSSNNEFMSRFNQKPLRSRGKTPSPLFASIKRFASKKAPHYETYRKESTRAKRENNKCDKKAPAAKTGSGFSFSIPSVATLAVVVLIGVAALNWENIEIKLPEEYIFQSVTESNAERHTMGYATAGIAGISRIIPELTPKTPETPEIITPESLISTEIPHIEDNIPNELLITFEWQQYRVQRGDSVSQIAKKFGVSIGAIIASNEIRNARNLQEGAVIRIPNIDGIPYQIKKGDSLSRIAANHNIPLDVILDVNDIKSDIIRAGDMLFLPGARMNDIDLRRSLGDLFAFPLANNRQITSPFGMRRDPISGVMRFHNGIDIRASIGTPVLASLDGVISVVGENRIYGKYIIMSHSNGYKTLYAHLSSFSVRQGDRVARGRKIGEVGNTGYSTGPHLHFSIFDRNEKWVNPLDLLN
jgi:murein DD-endopeptidase MepM/ murein hydrolase activator NlpD